MSLFLEDIESEKYLQQCTEEELAEIDHYMNDMQTGPADGDIDIEWLDSGRGYYIHLHELDARKGEDKKNYRISLEADIEEWLRLKPGNHMVEQVKSQYKNY